MPRVVGLLLAAGAGERFGGPKALAQTDGEAWVIRSARVLRDGGCDPVVVVVGAARDDVAALLDDTVTVVDAPDWAAGMGASLRAGVAAVVALDADAVLVHLVDLPDVGADVVGRLVAHAAPDVLARADYGNGPGHPVLIGRDHWVGVADAATGDRGARDYLARHAVTRVDCSDLADGTDVDAPPPMLGR
ncbi:nucleotidyltransferase family protein [Aeromicrobium wangtongii]|uniref:nucleotidyltransferase family protein n=1 Tax=Aeromicrobium wangtongii TaxID=2969247 RepID=UPI0020174370|nr:nucleotidyltransferase family protein [Aeromicrobium wangtongii]MCL3817722.1 nucleotidyltransferase family protein [Aeromicrobium wangtongii]